MLRGWSHSARTQEWVETIGVRDTSAACSIVVARDMRDIDQHAEPVQFRDRRAPERR